MSDHGSRAVRGWLEGLELTPEEAGQRSGLLMEFCEFVGGTPDDLVQRCLRTTKDGAIAIRSKGRAEVARAIDEFVLRSGREGHEAVVAGNVIRSFLISNGVFLPGRVSTD